MVMVKGEQNHRKTIDANGTRGKKPSYPIAPKNDHCSPLPYIVFRHGPHISIHRHGFAKLLSGLSTIFSLICQSWYMDL